MDFIDLIFTITMNNKRIKAESFEFKLSYDINVSEVQAVKLKLNTTSDTKCFCFLLSHDFSCAAYSSKTYKE